MRAPVWYIEAMRVGMIVAIVVTLQACGSSGSTEPRLTISVSETTLSIEVGEEVVVDVTVTGGTADVDFMSSNSSVASVSDLGVIRGESEGTAEITVSAGSAEAEIDVTVTEPETSITLVGMTQDGEAIDPNNLSGTVDMEFDIQTPTGFEGSLVILFDDIEVPLVDPDAPGSAPESAPGSVPSTTAPARVVVTGGGVKRASVLTNSVAVVSAEELEARTPNGTYDVLAQLESNTGSVVHSQSIGNVTLNNPNAIDLRGFGADRSLVLIDGRRVYSGSVQFQARQFSYGDPIIPMDRIERIEILRDGASAIYGSDAIGGVVNFILRDDVDPPDGEKGADGVRMFGATADVRFDGGSTATLPVINYDPELSAGQLPIGFEVDNRAPLAEDVFIPSRWAGGELSFTDYVTSNGFLPTDRYTGIDRCEYWAGTNAVNPEYLDILNALDLPNTSGLSLRWGADCFDLLENSRRYEFQNPLGGHSFLGITDERPDLEIGIGGFGRYDINPDPQLEYRVQATDVANDLGGLSGLSLTWNLSQSLRTPLGLTCQYGTIDANNDCAPEAVDFSWNAFTTSSSPPIPSQIRTTVSIANNAGIFSRRTRFGQIYDVVDPLFTADLNPSDGLLFDQEGVGEPFGGLSATDDLELERVELRAHYGDPLGFEFGLYRERIGRAFDADLVNSFTLNATANPLPRTLQYVEYDGASWRPQVQTLRPSIVAAYVTDTARREILRAYDATAILSIPTNLIPFISEGLDDFRFFGPSTLCNAKKDFDCGGVPEVGTFELNSFTLGDFNFQRVSLFKIPIDPEKDRVAWQLAETQALDVQDFGGFKFLSAKFQLNATEANLRATQYLLFVLGITDDNDALMSNSVAVDVVRQF